jgi:hypothetical protein
MSNKKQSSVSHNGTRLKCRFNALLADVMLSFCVGWINETINLKYKYNV